MEVEERDVLLRWCWLLSSGIRRGVAVSRRFVDLCFLKMRSSCL